MMTRGRSCLPGSGGTHSDVAEVYPPPVFWQKSLQADENKGSESEKERQEKPRVRNTLIRRGLWVVEDGKDVRLLKTHMLEGERMDETGTLSAEPCLEDYRI